MPFPGESSELHIRKKRLIDKTNIRSLPVQLTMAPYIVNILKDGNSICAGTILDPEIILTVENCFKEDLQSRIIVLSGSAVRNEGIPHNLTGRMFVSPTGLCNNNSSNLAFPDKEIDIYNKMTDFLYSDFKNFSTYQPSTRSQCEN